MGGGGSQNSTSTVYQSNLPKYAEPYYKAMMNRTLGESERPYQPYEGIRLAGMSDPTAQGLDMTAAYSTSSLTPMQDAISMSQQAGQMGMDAGNYTAGGVNNSYFGPMQGIYTGATFDPGETQYQFIGTGDFDQAALDRYSSPFMQAVVDKAKQDALLNYQEEAVMRNSQAATSGAFGGSRQAVMEQMARNQLQSNLTDIQVKGSQSAFENAQQQFERDRAARFAADRANQEAGLTASQANQRALLEAQQLGEQSRQFGYGTVEDAFQKAAQFGMTADQATEQLRQSGVELGLKGLDIANQSAQQMANSQQALDAMQLSRIKAQLGIGQTLEDYRQQSLDQSYNDFVNQRDAERQNLQFLSSILRGVPISANQDITQTQPSSPLTGMLGAATGIAALQGLGKQA